MGNDEPRGLSRLGEDTQASRIREAVATRLFGATPRVPTSSRYTFEKELGSGAMGTVWAARDRLLDRAVAIKVVSCGSRQVGMLERLRREARAMARLSHPNVVGVYDVAGTDDDLHLVMELVDGEDLQRWLSHTAVSWREVVEAFVQAGRGLAAAHAIGIVHRDFKPANVLRRHDGRVMVADFGLAVPSSTGQQSTRSDDEGRVDRSATRRRAGTPLFMAPEQHDGAPADARSDQYSFCTALYLAFHGAPPFRGDTLAALVAAKRQGPPSRPKAAIPLRLWRIVRRGLHADPRERWPSMDVVVDRLRGVLRSPHRGRWLGLAGIFATTAALLGAADDPTCSDAPRRVDEQRLEELRSRAEESGLDALASARLVSSLSGVAYDLVEEHQRACAAPPTPTLARRARCLAERARELDMVIELLETGDSDVIAVARELVAAVSPAEVCRAAELEDAADRSGSFAIEHADLRIGLKRVVLLETVGRHQEALAEARTMLNAVEQREATELQPRALYTLAVMHAHLGEYPEAEALWRRAYFSGWALGDLESVARAAILLVDLYGVRFGDHGEAMQWARHAVAAIERGRLESEFRVDLARTIGSAHLAAGRVEEALAQQRIALAQAQVIWPPGSQRLGVHIDDVAAALASLGRHAEALPLMREAFDIALREYGPDHPDRVGRHGNLGIVLHRLGEYDEARHHLDTALSLGRAVFPAGHERLALALTNRSNLHYTVGEYEDALSLRLEALEIRTAAFGEDARPTVRSRAAVADAARRCGMLELGRTHALRAVSSLEAEVRDGMGSREYGFALVVLGEVELALGERRRAEATLRKSLTIFEDADPMRVRAWLSLAEVFDSSRQDERIRVLEQANASASRLELSPVVRAETELALAAALRAGGHHERAESLERSAEQRPPSSSR